MTHPEQNEPLLHDAERQQDDPAAAEWVDETSAAARRRRGGRAVKAAVMTAVAAVHPAPLGRLLQRVAYAFVPQLLRTYVFADPAPKRKEFPTSYLNGLRGFTAVKVFTFHYFMAFTDATFMPYGMDEHHRYVTEWPIIRYVWTGFTAHIFFGLAGYLTCLRLFTLLDQNDQASRAKVLASVSGSLFRRAFRLYLPVFIITLIMATYIHLGWYETNRPLIANRELFPGWWNETKPDMYPTWAEQLRFWGSEMYRLCNFVSVETFSPLHDQHLWSILSEMRASLHLHGIIVALAMVKRPVRLVLLWALVFAYMWWDHWEIWVYILGAIVAQMDLMLPARHSAAAAAAGPAPPPAAELQSLPAPAASTATTTSTTTTTTTTTATTAGPGPSHDPEKEPVQGQEKEDAGVAVDDGDFASDASDPPRRRPSPFAFLGVLHPGRYLPPSAAARGRGLASGAVRIVGFLAAIYLLSFPILGANYPCPGFQTLADLIPSYMERKDKFYSNFGTFVLLVLLVRSDPHHSRWRRLLSHWLPQYLGGISFALYLVQEIVQHAVGYMIPQYVWWTCGVQGLDVSDAAWLSAILLGWALTLALTLWVADCWAREVEGRCVRFVKWLEALCFTRV